MKFCDCMHIKKYFFHKPSSRLASQNLTITQISIYGIRLRGPRGVGVKATARGLRCWGRARAHLLSGGGPGPGWGSAPVREVWNSGFDRGGRSGR